MRRAARSPGAPARPALALPPRAPPPPGPARPRPAPRSAPRSALRPVKPSKGQFLRAGPTA